MTCMATAALLGSFQCFCGVRLFPVASFLPRLALDLMSDFYYCQRNNFYFVNSGPHC